MYRLFGLPRTFEEFVGKIKKAGANKVDINITEIGNGYEVYVEAGEIKQKIWRGYVGNPMSPIYEYSLGGIKTEAMGYALLAANKIDVEGLGVEINGRPRKEILEEYEKGVKRIELFGDILKNLFPKEYDNILKTYKQEE